MNNLTPQIRPDKNGNFVTRWVNPFRNTSSSKPSPIPVVTTPLRSAVPVTEEREKQYKELAQVLRENMTFGDISEIEPSLKTIARYDPELLDKITHAVESNPLFESEFWAEMFGNRHVISDVSPKRLEEMLEKCNAAFPVNSAVNHLASKGGDIATDVYTCMQMGDLVNSITRGRVTGDFDSTIAGVTMIAHIKQLNNASSWAAIDGDVVTYTKILDAAEYIASRKEDVYAILPELMKRGSFDRETIEMLLDAPASAMMNGAL